MGERKTPVVGRKCAVCGKSATRRVHVRPKRGVGPRKPFPACETCRMREYQSGTFWQTAATRHEEKQKDLDKIKRLLRDGFTKEDVSRKTGIERTRVYRLLRKT